jgi:hypothetical protein
MKSPVEACKTMLGIAFLAHGALEHNESGV